MWLRPPLLVTSWPVSDLRLLTNLTAAVAGPPTDAVAQPQVTALDLEANPGVDLATLVAQMQALQSTCVTFFNHTYP